MKQEVLLGLMLIDDAVDEKNRKIDECLSKIALGDMTALDKLYVLCATDIYSFALSMMHNVHEAEDALQETFIAAISRCLKPLTECKVTICISSV